VRVGLLAGEGACVRCQGNDLVLSAAVASGKGGCYHSGMIHRETISIDGGAYLAEFEPAEEGGYVVRFPAIPDMATEGRSLEEARVMAADLLHGYLETLRELGRPVPSSEPQQLAAR
jgi:predicted RNase H-like HicB family nuclease